MSYTIYSNSDVDMMESLFNALAAWASTGGVVDLGPTAGSAIIPYQLLMTGIAIGIITALLQSIMRGGDKIEIGPVFLSMCLFLVMFVPKTTVIIQSNQTGEMRAVANVPVGAAVPGWFFSSIGAEFTEITETLFGMPSGTGVSDQGFGQTLAYFKELEEITAADRMFDALDRSLGGGHVDTFASVKNYLRDCTLQKTEVEGRDPQIILSYEVDELAFNVTTDSTDLRLDPADPQPQEHTCDVAWPLLESSVFNNFSTNEARQVLNKVFNISESQAAAGRQPLTEASKNNAALGFNVNVQDFFSMAVLRPATVAAMAEHESRMGNTAGATALEMNYHSTRITQQTSMIGKGFAWRDMMLHLMTFAELIFYGVLPIMSLILACGVLGLKSFSKFMILGIWIQMWMPMMALVDFYIDFQAKDMMVAVAAGLSGSGSLSIDNFAAAAEAAQQALSTGYSFMPMIPILSLFILTGSMMAATKVFDGAGQASGAIGAGAALDPKNEAFGAKGDGKGGYTYKDAMMSTSAGAPAYRSAGGISGESVAGRSGETPTISSDSTFQQMTNQTASRLTQAQEQLTGMNQDVWSQASRQGLTEQLTNQYGKGLVSEESQRNNAVSQQAAAFGEEFGLSEQQQEKLAAQMQLRAIGVPGIQIGAGIDGSASQTTGESWSEGLKRLEQESLAEEQSAGWKADASQRLAQSWGATSEDSETSQQTKQLSRQASEVGSLSAKLDEMESEGSQLRTGGSYHLDQFANDGMREKINALESGLTPEQREDFNDRFNDLFRANADAYDLGETTNTWGSKAQALMEVAPEEFGNMFFGGTSYDDQHAATPEGLDDPSTVKPKTPEQTGSGADQPVGGPGQMDSSNRNAVLTPPSTDTVLDETLTQEPKLKGDAEDNMNDVAAGANAARGALAADTALSQIEQGLDKMGLSDNVFSYTDGDELGSLLGGFTNELASTGEAFTYTAENVAEAWEQDGFGGVLAAFGESMFGDGMGEAIRENYDANQDQMISNLENHFRSIAPEGLTDAQEDFYVAAGMAQVMNTVNEAEGALGNALAHGNDLISGGVDVAFGGTGDAFRRAHEAHMENSAYGAAANEYESQRNTAGVNVLNEAIENHAGDADPQRGNNAGSLLLQELSTQSFKQAAPELVVAYNEGIATRDSGGSQDNNGQPPERPVKPKSPF